MALEDYADIIHRCFRCGYCKLTSDYSDYNCPAYGKFRMETYSPGGRLWLIRAMMNGDLKESAGLAEILYTCTMCFNCVEKCNFEFHTQIIDMMIAARMRLTEKPVLPPVAGDYLTNIQLHGNPWKKSRKKRGDWTKRTGIPAYERGHEYLFYVGDIGSYDPMGQEMAKKVARVLSRAGVSFGILGEAEFSDGNDVYTMGEEGLFEDLAEKNIQQFREKGIERVITLSPHAYNIMKNFYPKIGGNFEVIHYTGILREILSQGGLKMQKSRHGERIVYHDPCFLGRWNKEYDAPRELLQAVPGVALVEMARNRENAFCCGGGGGNVFTDILGGGDQSPARVRIREAYATGATVLAVACPACLSMLGEALKAEHMEEKMAVRDLSDIVNESL